MKSIDMVTGEVLEYDMNYNATKIDLTTKSFNTSIIDGKIKYHFFIEMNNALHTIEITMAKWYKNTIVASHNKYLRDGTFHYRINSEKSLCVDMQGMNAIYLYRIDS